MKPGGELIYATCSVLEVENEQVIDAFLQSEQGRAFKLVPLHEADSFKDETEAMAYICEREDKRGLFQSTPLSSTDFDGHFCARLIYQT